MKWPQPTRADHEKFCHNEDWRQVRDAKGRKGTHHVTFELDLPDGRILRTRISHPVDRTDYGPQIWQHILRDQLAVTEAEFWACVREKRRPNRGSKPEPTARALPADVVYQLLTKVGLSEQEVALLTREQAIARLQQHWSDDEHGERRR